VWKTRGARISQIWLRLRKAVGRPVPLRQGYDFAITS
jgi:hypothetical protein